MPEPQINRYQLVTVKDATNNQYGDLIFHDTEGKEHKIGNKRSAIFPAIQPGAEVNLGYAVYMNREYIATAEQTGKHINIEAKSDHLVEAAKKMGAEVISVEKKDSQRQSIEAQTALKAAVEWCGFKVQAGVDVKTEDVIKVAQQFRGFLNS